MEWCPAGMAAGRDKEFTMRKILMAAFLAAACAVCAETTREHMQRLFRERVQIYFKTEGLKRRVEAAVYDPSITSEAIAAARGEMDQARVQYITLNARASLLTREEKEVPQELRDATAEAAGALEAAQAKHRGAVMEHPKVKAMAGELKQAEDRAEEIRVEYEALQEKEASAE